MPLASKRFPASFESITFLPSPFTRLVRTVARAYGELEREGVVVTEGARGTRVAQRLSATPSPAGPETLAGLLRPVAVAAFHLEKLVDSSRRGPQPLRPPW